MIKTPTRATAGLAAAALVASGLTLATSAPTATADVKQCVAANPTETITVFGFNDFHGRVIDDTAKVDNPSRYLAGRLFTPVEQARATQGEDNVLLLSSGDNVGASTFVSMVSDDTPTLDVLNAAGVEVSTVGNHEFDKGWSDLAGRIVSESDFPYLGANVYQKGTTTVAAPLQPYEIIEKAGVKIAVVGAVTGDVPSLVSPAGISTIEFGDPVAAVNRVTKQLLDGDTSNGEADVVLASFHEGAAKGSETAAQNAAASTAFNAILNDLDPRLSGIFNAHTHQVYTFETAGGVPIIQAGEYANDLGKLDLVVDSTTKGVCSSEVTVLSISKKVLTPDESFTRIKTMDALASTAYDKAMEIGSKVIGAAEKAISTPGEGGTGTRDQESPMTNAVAQMFHDKLGAGDEEFIGIQNPGGTRDSFNAGDVTYREAAMALPFANSLFTTQLTGAQFKTALEQQWQLGPDGNVPSRPFLQLGLSNNVTYTYDESLPRGSRITSISINGKPIDPAKLYTVASGSFLITGGDNFREFANGVNQKDTGKTDLSTWVEWVTEKSPLSPDYSKRGVSAKLPIGKIEVGGPAASFQFGAVPAKAVAPQSLDMFLLEGDKVSPKLANREINAYLGSALIGTGAVKDGIATISVTLTKEALAQATARAAGDAQAIRFEVADSGTRIYVPVTVEGGGAPNPTPSVKPTSPSEPSPSAKPGPVKPGPPSTGVTN